MKIGKKMRTPTCSTLFLIGLAFERGFQNSSVHQYLWGMTQCSSLGSLFDKVVRVVESHQGVSQVKET